MKTPIICAGFHRSGTSLAAQMLYRSGIPYAIDSMPGSISNPDGHFEDTFAMRMHDDFLGESNTNWQFHDECQLNHRIGPAEHRIRQYSKLRDKLHGNQWLMKDPRATLFLDEWQTSLQGKGRFILLFRHWALCIQSLYKRHAQDIAHHFPPETEINTHLKFWQQPDLAARMWLTYNKNLIAFSEKNPDITLVVNQKDIVNGDDLISAVNHKFDLHLTPLTDSPVNKAYYEEKVDSKILEGIPQELIQELDETYQKLTQLTELKNTPENPDFITKPYDSVVFNLIHQRLSQPVKQSTEKPTISSSERRIQPLSSDFMETLHIIRQLNFNNSDDIEYIKRLISHLISLNPLRFEGYEWKSRLHVHNKEYHKAEFSLLNAIALGASPPYIRSMLSDVYIALFDFDKAEHFLKLAYKGNPKNPVFSEKLGDINYHLENFNQAREFYKESLELNEKPSIKSKIIDTFHAETGAQSAINELTSFKTDINEEWYKTKSISLNLSLRNKDSNKLYSQYIVKKILSNKNKTNIFNLINKKINNSEIESLSYWLTRSYGNFINKTDLISTYISETGQSPENPKVSVVVISYNMDRELPRTLKSLLSPYQRNINPEDLEIIVIDNGSDKKSNNKHKNNYHNVRFIDYPDPSHSPVHAINLGLKLAKSNLIGVMIDGARMASPGLFEQVLNASRLSKRTVISTLGFHLGPEVQMKSVLNGYNQELEDRLLQTIDWENNGYKLFEISSLAGSSANGYFEPIAESNAIFMERSLWEELDGFDKEFQTPGGGFSNLDLYHRACNLPNSQLAIILNEGTFHQVHGGVATNSQRKDASAEVFNEEYEKIRGCKFFRPNKEAIYIGRYVSEANDFLKTSIDYSFSKKPIENTTKILNRYILDSSYCTPYKEEKKIADDVIDRPIIITGRGGSGTRLLSELIQETNIFLGNKINNTNDSTEWVGPIYDLVNNNITIKNGKFNKKHVARLRNNARNILSTSNENIKHWGFKLPEAILCLPELKSAFPNARFIHLVRHPVSISLRRTHITSRTDNPIGKSILTRAYNELNFNPDEVNKNPDYLNNAISWEFQVKKASSYFSENLKREDHLQIFYESIISNPNQVIENLCSFLGIEKIPVPDLNIDRSRQNSSNHDMAHANEVWEICKATAMQIGYKETP